MSATPHNALTQALLDTLRRLRRAHERYRALAEVLHVSVELLAEQSRELDRLRARYYALLEERREQQRAA